MCVISHNKTTWKTSKLIKCNRINSMTSWGSWIKNTGKDLINSSQSLLPLRVWHLKCFLFVLYIFRLLYIIEPVVVHIITNTNVSHSHPALCLHRCIYHLLDARPGHPPSRRLLCQLQRPHLWKVLLASCRVQLGHEPHHLLLPRQGDERHLQADPVLSAAGERQRDDGGGIWPISVVNQPHGAEWRYAPSPSQQRTLSGIKEGKRLQRLIQLLDLVNLFWRDWLKEGKWQRGKVKRDCGYKLK